MRSLRETVVRLPYRAFLPQSQQVWVVDEAERVQRPMRRIHPAGLFEAICPISESFSERRYCLRVATDSGQVLTMHDPYCFEPLLTDLDFYLFAEGKHLDAYKKMGAQLATSRRGRREFRRVGAQRRERQHRRRLQWLGWPPARHAQAHSGGVWELFIPGVGAGGIYKFRVKSCWGDVADRCDPYGFAAELPPRTARTSRDSKTTSGTTEWMNLRAASNPTDQPFAVYEVHLGSWSKIQNACMAG